MFTDAAGIARLLAGVKNFCKPCILNSIQDEVALLIFIFSRNIAANMYFKSWFV